MKKLTNAMIVLSMVFSIVFLSEAISSNNPLSVQAQTQYQQPDPPQYQQPTPTYKKRPKYRWIRVKRCRWIRVHRCRWVRIKVRVKKPRRYGYTRPTAYQPPANTYKQPKKTY